jgi:capsular exopolysaccharide synthesis family protein
MPDINSFQERKRRLDTEQEESINLRKLFFKMLTYWYYFLAALIIAFICARVYNSYTIPVYNVSTTLLIEENKKGGSLNTDKILEGFGLSPDMQNLDNQILILSSYTLVGKTLNELNFDIDFEVNGLSLYPIYPIAVVPEKEGQLPKGHTFIFSYLHDSIFSLDAASSNLTFHKQARFGEMISCAGGNFKIAPVNDQWLKSNAGKELSIVMHLRSNLIESFSGRLKVEPVSKKSTIVKISLQSINVAKDIDFLNKLAEVFQNTSLEKKNKEALRTILFIDDQLIGITDSLVITENRLQQFRSQNKVMDLSAQGQVIINQAMKLENDKARLLLEANYYKYLADYLKKDNVDEVPIAPATQGISDPGLTKLVQDLAELQSKFYSIGLGEKNPLRNQLAQQLRNTKDALMEILKGVRRANEMAMHENNEQIRTINSQATALPMTERQLLGIERKFKLNDVLYTFLLEKRAEAQIQKASNTPDNEVVDPARPDSFPVSPKTKMSFLIALLAGLGLPFIWIWLVNEFNNKVTDEDDIKKITDFPFAGHIPHSASKTQNVVFEDPHSYVTEAFRTLRTKMQFFTKDTKSPVILISSSLPGEGKTFTAINLASAYSLMGKKTILLGFDLRRPKIFSDFGLSNEKGITTWLIGRDKLDEVIIKTEYPNLDILLSGVQPPNPSELIASEKTGELFIELKKRYDYIIVDSAPLGSVSDAYSLIPYADTSLIIVRDEVTLKHALEKTIFEIKANEIKNFSILENDINQTKIVYRYGNRYGYSYGSKKGERGLLWMLGLKKW